MYTSAEHQFLEPFTRPLVWGSVAEPSLEALNNVSCQIIYKHRCGMWLENLTELTNVVVVVYLNIVYDALERIRAAAVAADLEQRWPNTIQ